MKIKKNDNVLVISGKDRGRKGKVTKVLTKQGRILVEGLNIQKKHRRPKRQGQKGEVLEIPAPMPISKVKIVCPKCTKPARVGYKISGESKYRVCKKCGEAI
jgi:large subunit ribosomal protein L24